MINYQTHSPVLHSSGPIYDQIKAWIQPHEYLISKAGDRTYPLLERVNFLVKFHTSLDTFFKTRVLDLPSYLEKDGSLESENRALAVVLEQLYALLYPLLEIENEIWNYSIFPALLANGITIRQIHSLDAHSQRRLREYFYKEVFPIITPLAFDKTHPFPYISNLSLNLAVILKETPQSPDLFVRIKTPEDQFPRLIPIESEPPAANSTRYDLVFLEDLISSNLDLLFPGMQIVGSYPFRVTRNSRSLSLNLDTEKERSEETENPDERRQNSTVRIEVSYQMDKITCGVICDKLLQFSRIFYRTRGPIGMADMSILYTLNRPDLKYKYNSDMI